MAKELDIMILQELGFDINSKGNIVDQSCGNELCMNGKILNIDSRSKNTIQYEPSVNPKQMYALFSKFLNNVEEEGGDSFNAIYDFEVDRESGTSRLGCNGYTSKIESAAYVNDVLKYLDCAMRINGDQNPDLKKFDVSKEEYIKQRKEFNNRK